jgi:hypothetical protein
MAPHGYILTAFLVVLACVALKLSNKNDIPFVNPPGWFRPIPLARMDFFKTGMQVLSKAKSTVADKPFKLLSEAGYVTVLPPRFAHSIRNEKDLSFADVVKIVGNPNSLPATFHVSQCGIVVILSGLTR